MLRTIRNLFRLARILRILARHDALFLAYEVPLLGLVARLISRRRPDLRPGQRLAGALQELGPIYVKFGQALSTRSDLIGEEMSQDLSMLQDQLPPFPAAIARATIEAELGRPLGELYAHFEDEPVAAASIAQVHFAETRGSDGQPGQPVAVKILRPGIEDKFARDFELFFWLAALAERLVPASRRLKPTESLVIIEETVRTELDLRLEAAAASEMADNFAGDTTYRTPTIDWLRTGQRVMTMERIEGLPMDEREALMALGLDVNEILGKAANAFFNQVFRDGFFHADLHPGNLFVDAAGDLVVVDFGIMGRLDEQTRRYLGEMLLGFLNRDYRRVAEVHFEAGYVPAHKSVDLFTQACRSIGEPILGLPLHEISIARLLGQLFKVTEDFAMEAQPQLLLLQKTMLVAEGVGRKLDPRVNMWELARPLIEDWMIGHLGPGARIKDALGSTMAALERMPTLLANADRTLARFADGGLKLHEETLRALTGNRRRSPRLAWLIVGLLLGWALARVF